MNWHIFSLIYTYIPMDHSLAMFFCYFFRLTPPFALLCSFLAASWPLLIYKVLVMLFAAVLPSPRLVEAVSVCPLLLHLWISGSTGRRYPFGYLHKRNKSMISGEDKAKQCVLFLYFEEHVLALWLKVSDVDVVQRPGIFSVSYYKYFIHILLT